MIKILEQFPPFLLAGIWAVFILVASTVGVGVSLPPDIFELLTWDKLAHAFVYFILCYLLYSSFSRKTNKRKAIIYAISISISYGILMEITQYSFFPNRYFEFFDIFANIVGSILNVVFIYFLTDKKSQSYG